MIPGSQSKTWSLVCVYLLSFTSSASVSVIAPFFPTEAQKKGMSLSTAGYVFSVHGAALIVMNCFVGKILPHIGNKIALAVGIIVLGMANIMFGLLDKLEAYIYFAVLCFVARVIEAVGASLTTTTSFMTLLKMYPDNSAKPIALNEAVVSAGYMLGPVIGSALFAIGGYVMPFIVTGASVLLILPLSIFFIESYRESDEEETRSSESDDNPRISYTKLILIFDVFFVCVALLIATVNFGSMESTLGLYLESYNINASISGFFFFIPSAAYFLCSAVLGHLYDYRKSDMYYLFGLCLSAAGYLCIGPFSEIRSIRSIYMVVLSLMLLGVGSAFVIIPTMPSAMRAIKNSGYGESVTTCSLVSALWTTVYSLGYVIGPMFGATAYENFGYAIFSLIIASLNVIIAILCAYFVDSRREDDEIYEKLCESEKRNYNSNQSAS